MCDALFCLHIKEVCCNVWVILDALLMIEMHLCIIAQFPLCKGMNVFALVVQHSVAPSNGHFECNVVQLNAWCMFPKSPACARAMQNRQALFVQIAIHSNHHNIFIHGASGEALQQSTKQMHLLLLETALMS
jgi:hypothetical protein